MAWDPQRIYEARFAWSPHKESAFGTVLADAKFTHSCQPLGFDPPGITRTFRSDAGRAWGGSEHATTRAITRQGVAYPFNVELSALLAAHIMGCCLGKVTTTPGGTGPPAAYSHAIIFQDPLVDGLQLPSSGHWFKPADDLGLKTKGAVCSGFSLSYTQGQPIVTLNSNWIGNGDYTAIDISPIPALDTDVIMGTLFEKDLDILLGAHGAATSIKDRVAAFSLDIGNGVDGTEKYFAGCGLYGGKAWQGKRTIVPSLTIFAKATDDILALFTGDTEQELIFRFIGDLITGTDYMKVDIDIPAVHFGTPLKIGAQGDFVVWQLAPGDEGVFKLSAHELVTITVVNKEAAFLTV
jgi:hypothetical protein